MPQWIHDRAQHLQAKNPEMPESMAWGLATQQSHALGKSPKGYGTAEGRSEAKAKYDTPSDDKKTANPGGIGKEAGLFSRIFKPALTQTMDDYTRTIVRDEIGKSMPKKNSLKSKTAGIRSVLDLMDGFSHELNEIAKTAALVPPAGMPTRVSEVVSAMPRATGKTPLPKSTPINTDAAPSPSQSLQPVLSPPQVRS